MNLNKEFDKLVKSHKMLTLLSDCDIETIKSFYNYHIQKILEEHKQEFIKLVGENEICLEEGDIECDCKECWVNENLKGRNSLRGEIKNKIKELSI